MAKLRNKTKNNIPLLPRLLAWITKSQRVPVVVGKDFEWSDRLFVHNIFRIYELIFWRKKGVRVENSTEAIKLEDGSMLLTYTFYTYEAMFAHAEGMFRLWVSGLISKWKNIRFPEFDNIFEPQFAFAGMGVTPPKGIFPKGYFFAVALDGTATTGGVAGIGSSYSYSHTVSGANRFMAQAIAYQDNTSVSSFSYAGVGGTVGSSAYISFTTSNLSRITAPTTGTNTVSVSLSGATAYPMGTTISFTGVDQTTPIEATNTATGNSTTPSLTVTTTTNNCLVLDAIGIRTDSGDVTLTVNGSQTQRSNHSMSSQERQGTSTELKSTAGAVSMDWTLSGSRNWAMVGFGVRESTATNVTVNATVLSATFSLPASTVTAIRNASVASTVLSATFSTPARTITTSVSIAQGVLSATFSIPTYNVVIADALITPSPIALTFSTPAPTITTTRTVVVSSSVLVATFAVPSFTPTGTSGITVAITTIPSATFSTPSPTITATRTVIISREILQLILTIPAFTVRGDFWQEKFSLSDTSWSDKISQPSTNWSNKY